MGSIEVYSHFQSESIFSFRETGGLTTSSFFLSPPDVSQLFSFVLFFYLVARIVGDKIIQL